MVDLLRQFLQMDALSLFFLAVIFIVSLPSAIYSIGYLKHEYSGGKIISSWILLSLFVLSMAAVVLAGNLLVFLVAWEIMSLVSYFFVVFDSSHDRSIQAGSIYIVMTHAGTAFLVAAFLLLYQYAHAFDFISIKNACGGMPAQAKNTVFLLLLAGFGTKAGIVPLHVWLPYAHPQAPSHVSALMSGVMIKTAVYGLIRFVIFLLGADSSWWGILILVLAGITCLVGVIYALMDRDIKRLLAYSSVENMGIILFGVGLCMLFSSWKMERLAVFALIAGLYHLINHAIFKGLLFLGAGAVYKATGTRDIEKLGGLIKKMPQTAFYFLIGSMAICALPPLNGFVSEWLTLQAFFQGAANSTGATRLFLGMGASCLALTGGLAVACFVKAFGIVFLGLPRSNYAQGAKEAPLSMRAGMFFLGFLAVAFGLAANPIIKLLSRVASSATGADVAMMDFSLQGFSFTGSGQPTGLSPAAIGLALAMIAAAALTAGLWRRIKPASGVTWDCGYYKFGALNQYSGTAFSKPLRIAFSFFLMPYRKTQKVRESFYHVKSFAYETHNTFIFKKYIYSPLIALILKGAKSMRRIQPGSIHLYLGYIFIALILLLVFIDRF